MAKTRRVLRKASRPAHVYFDEQLWPIYIALVVLGGFLMGVTAAYGRFTDVPWYANAWLAVISIPLCIAGVLVAFRVVENTVVRRSMQLSIVLALILHVGMIVQLVETRIYASRSETSMGREEIVESRPRRYVPDYHPSQLVDESERPQQDFERPVEVATPEPIPNPQEVVREQQPPEDAPPIAATRPIPVPENASAAEPNVIRRNQPNEVAPRQAPQSSLLSRQLRASELKLSQPIDVPSSAANRGEGSGLTAGPASSAAAVARTATGPAAAARAAAEPTTDKPAETPQVARRAEVAGDRPEVSSTPALRRQVAQPTATPRTQIATSDTPSQSQRTAEGELAAANTTSVQRTTTSPAVARTATPNPALEISREPASATKRRENPADVKPGDVAQTPSPVSNRQPRATLRPDVATTAAVEGTAGAGSDASSAGEAAPSASQLERATTQVRAVRSSSQPATESNSSQSGQPALQITRASGRDGPVATANPTAAPTLTRRSGTPSLPGAGQTAEVAVGAAVGNGSGGEVSPTSTATRRQTAAAAQAGPSVGEPGAAQIASIGTESSLAPGLLRRASGGGSPAAGLPGLGGSGDIPTVGRGNRAGVTNVVTTVGNVPANASPESAGIGTPAPSQMRIARGAVAGGMGETGGGAAQSGSASAPEVSPSAGAGVGLAAARSRIRVEGGGPGSGNFSGAPGIEPTGVATGTPRRALASAVDASSPIAVDSPAMAGTASGAPGGSGSGGTGSGGFGSGEGSAQPSRLALSRGQGGIAGGGRSANVGDSLAGGDGPALTASGSARRAAATQEGPPGDALAPSRPSLVARSRAGSDVPTSTIKAEGAEFGSVGGGSLVAEVSASSGAGLTRGNANAAQGSVTAARGTGEVDLGPTQLVAEAGIGRAGGGGQPQLTFVAPEGRLARSTGGGGGGEIPLMALAAAKVGDVAAPEGAGGGTGGGNGSGEAIGLPGLGAVGVTRGGGGGAPAVSGGLSLAGDGPSGEGGTAALVSTTAISRADAAEGNSGGAGTGGGFGIKDEDEKNRRLARATIGGGPALAIAGAVAADVPASPVGEGGDGGFPGASAEASASSVAASRGNRAGGGPAGGAPFAVGEVGEPGGAGSGATGGGIATGSLTIARAEASDGPVGEAIAGGGTGKVARAAAGALFSASVDADTVSIAGAPASGGSSDGAPLEAQGIATARVAGGALGSLRSGPIGAAEGADVVDAPAPSLAGNGYGRRNVSPSTEDGPAIDGQVNRDAAPGRVTRQINLVGGGTTVADIPEIGPMSAVAQAESDHLPGGAGQGTAPMTRQSGVGMTVSIDAPDGPGGLGSQYTPEVGLNTRQARSDSEHIHTQPVRFVKTTVGGLPSVNTGAIASTEAFSGRDARPHGGQRGAGGPGTPGAAQQDAIEKGLAFLARYQQPDGGWSLQGFPEEAQLVTDTGATGLALLAFQGAGYTHREDEYQNVVQAGLSFLLKGQKENGDLFVPLDDESNRSVWLYSHSLATLALCEAYGMTQDPELKEPAQKALDFIVASQDQKGGGWRYSPGLNTDTSVTGWMMMALKSGELAGLNVPKETYARIEKWIDASQQSPSEPHLYRYNPFAPDTAEQRHGRKASKTMTSVGLLMRLYSGWRRDNGNMIRGAEYLAQNLPAIGTPRQPERDTYYWYYGTQVMFHMGGEYWQRWNSRLHPLIVESQVPAGPLAGSWDPKGAVPDRWGPHGGRLYVTTLNLLSLEVFYRHLPLYEDTAK